MKYTGLYLTFVFACPALLWGGDFSIKGDFSSSVFIRSDGDFDSNSQPTDSNSQVQGQFTHYFKPQFLWSQNAQLSLYYEVEMGIVNWDLNAPDRSLSREFHPFLMRHKELWASWDLGQGLVFKTGYQYLEDPSRLYFSHWVGAITLEKQGSSGAFKLSLGQMPDNTIQGMDFRSTGPGQDIFFSNLDLSRRLSSEINLQFFGAWLGDFSRHERAMNIFTIQGAMAYESPAFRLWAQLLAQTGHLSSWSPGGGDEFHLAMAMQAGMSMRRNKNLFGFNMMLLSPDDKDGNGYSHAFFYSGRNLSPTLILTEDEFRDRHNNVDETSSQRYGSFFVSRAGSLIMDSTLGYSPNPFLHTAAILGFGISLNPDNAAGGRLLGIEGNLLADFILGKQASFLLIAQAFLPGEASSVFVNQSNPRATDFIFGAQAAFMARF